MPWGGGEGGGGDGGEVLQFPYCGDKNCDDGEQPFKANTGEGCLDCGYQQILTQNHSGAGFQGSGTGAGQCISNDGQSGGTTIKNEDDVPGNEFPRNECSPGGDGNPEGSCFLNGVFSGCVGYGLCQQRSNYERGWAAEFYNDGCSGGGDDGGGGGGGGGPPPPPPPASVDLRVNGVDSLGSPLEVPASFTLSWTSANADSCSASGNWSGGKSTGGSESFSDIPRGTYSYTLNCSGPGGSGSDSVSFQVVQVPRCSLSANPVQIVRPQQSTLSWTCQYADSCSIDNGVGSVNNVSGTANVSPIQSTLYSLTCGGLDGSRSFSAMVSVFVSGLKEVLPR